MYISTAFFSTDLFWSCLKWLMIFIIWAIFALGTWREDRKIRKQLREPLKEVDAQQLMQTLHRRDMQIWMQVSLLLVIVAANDIRHDAAQLPPDYFAPPASAPAALPVSEPPKPVQARPTADETYDKVIKNNTSPGMPFSDITAFNEQNGKQEAYIDWLKERYESWLVTYYYLEKCRAVGPGDYDSIHHAMETDLATAHADSSVGGNILLAATGSYKEMYINIPCDKAHLTVTKSSYDANMQQMNKPHTQNTVNPKREPATTTGSSH
jgi:hypothetical protein